MKQKLIKGPIKGFKGTDVDMKCNGFHFKMSEMNVLDNDNPLELWTNGFHFYQQPSGPFCYKNYARIFKVEAYDVLDSPNEPGADYKQVCRKIVFIEEVKACGDWNTGYGNTGNRNAGNWNTGDWNTGHGNTGDRNAGHRNIGNGNAGDGNTGDRNAGHWNAGNGNTGHGNTGDRNAGSGNVADFCSGYFCTKTPKVVIFDKPTNIPREKLDMDLISRLSQKLQSPQPFDLAPFLSLPNATEEKIKNLHIAYKQAIERKEK